MNLIATEVAGQILLERILIMSPAVVAEAIYIFSDESRAERLQIDGALLARENVAARAVALEDEEIALSVRYAQYVDDGEAQTLAIATARGLSVLTDDVGGIRFARTLKLDVLTTLDLVHSWSTDSEPSTVRRALRLMRARANYAVPRLHPLRAWYADLIADGESA